MLTTHHDTPFPPLRAETSAIVYVWTALFRSALVNFAVAFPMTLLLPFGDERVVVGSMVGSMVGSVVVALFVFGWYDFL